MSYATLARKTASVAPAPKSAAAVSTSLRIGEPNDSFEQEADRIADEVMAGGRSGWSLSSMGIGGPLRRKCSCGGSGECSECKEEKTLQRKADGAAKTVYAPPIVNEVLRSPGQPLDSGTRSFFEPRFGYDFSHVRVHRGSRESESAQSVNALAYTVGSDIVLGPGASTGSTGARRLLAHELAHTIQQSEHIGLHVAPRLQRGSADPSAIPKGMTCVTDPGPGSGAELSLTGVKVTGGLSAAQKKQIGEFHKMWVAGGSKDFIAVEGYASPDTTNDSAAQQKANWGYSCKRAELVQEEFIKLGVPRSRVITFAHGETDQFSSSLKAPDPNRRVDISRVQVGPIGGGAAQPAPVQGPTSMQVTGKSEGAKTDVDVKPSPKPTPAPAPAPVPTQPPTETGPKERVLSVTFEFDLKNDWKSPAPPSPATKPPFLCTNGVYQLGIKWNGLRLKDDTQNFTLEFFKEPELDLNVGDPLCAQNPSITAQVNLIKFTIFRDIVEADLVGLFGLPDGWATGLSNFPFGGAGQVKLQFTPFARLSPDLKGIKIGGFGGIGFEQGVQVPGAGEEQRTQVWTLGGFIGLDYDAGPAQKKEKEK